MSILWTALRSPQLMTWACCGLVVFVVQVECPSSPSSPTLQEPVTVKGKSKPVATKNHSAGGRCFLGFELPAGKGAGRDVRQRFEIVPKLSRVGVDLSTPIGGVTAKSSCVGGSLVATPNRPESDATAALMVKTASLSTGNRKYDTMIHDALQAKTHKEIRLTLRSLAVADRDLKAQKLSGVAHCTLWICGQAHRVQIPVAVRREQAPGHGRLLVVKGDAKFSLSKMGVEVPRTLGIPLIHDKITLWLAVRGRHLGPDQRHEAVARAR